MTSEIVRPLNLPTAGEVRERRTGRGAGRRPLTLPHLPALRGPKQVTCAFTAIDVHGRLAAPALLHLLGWGPGTMLEVADRGGLLLLMVSDLGTQTVTARLHVGLPAHVRHWHRLTAGTRLLLVADVDAARLVVHPPAALEAMIICCPNDRTSAAPTSPFA
ncbi:MAG TPA: hypothetical protein VFC19_00135 [Candidatus Limnocylindrales bacterium]|nr:hypothetical protein [Candidatus Limnocylindrales bacterium]